MRKKRTQGSKLFEEKLAKFQTTPEPTKPRKGDHVESLDGSRGHEIKTSFQAKRRLRELAAKISERRGDTKGSPTVTLDFDGTRQRKGHGKP